MKFALVILDFSIEFFLFYLLIEKCIDISIDFQCIFTGVISVINVSMRFQSKNEQFLHFQCFFNNLEVIGPIIKNQFQLKFSQKIGI